MDNSLFRWINRLANRTGWAHGFFTANAKYGIVLFSVPLIVAYLDGRQHDDLRAVAGNVWAGLALGGTVAAIGVVIVVPTLSRGLELLGRTKLRVLVLNGPNLE